VLECRWGTLTEPKGEVQPWGMSAAEPLTSLQSARIRAGLSRRDLSRLSGLSYERLRQLEHEPDRAQPRTVTARLLASILGVSVAELFPGLDR
jgi:transcriptional regulator with XRE-family HTH domain